MRKRTPHTKNQKSKIKNQKLIFIGFVIVFFLIFGFLMKGKLFPVLIFFSQPLSDLRNFLNTGKIVFTEKLILSEENKRLKETVALLKSQALTNQILQKELKDTESDLGRIKFYEEKPVLAKIIFRYFDSLIVDVGEENGIAKDMKAVAFGSVFVGRVSDVYKDYSRIKLISQYNNEENVFLGESGISAIMRGQGNYEFAIELPSSLEIETGESVYTLSRKPYLIGLVEKIKKNETESLQKIHFTFPFNLNEVHSVFIAR